MNIYSFSLRYALFEIFFNPGNSPARIRVTSRKLERSAMTREFLLICDVSEGVDDAIAALVSGEVEAVVYEAPNLLYYANGEGKGKVTVVGRIFEPQGYGLALPHGSILRKKINLAILELIESGG
jgi:polar amino acid transport system substrate-binding protein